MSARRGEWVFSLTAPHLVTTNDKGEATPLHVELQSNQGSSSSVKSTKHKRPVVPPDSKHSTNNTASSSSSSLEPETTSLLSSQTPDASSSPTAGSGWTFSSASWCLSSDILLKVTYRPAWQALPEYTQTSVAADWCRRTTNCCRSKTCSTKKLDLAQDVYTTEHIVRVEDLSNMEIRGIGRCQAVRVWLSKSNSMYDDDRAADDVPAHLSAALQHQQTLSETHRDDNDYGDSTPWSAHGADSLPPISEQDENDKRQNNCIAITFAMPLEKDDFGPPLLWKVQIPPCKEVAVDSYTVLQGRLHTRVNQNPTHIYINGYQSWSFAGSVVRGDMQPASAMPSTFSGAFNRGAAPAPPPMVFRDDDEEEYDTPTTLYQSDFFTCITSDGHVGQVVRGFAGPSLRRLVGSRDPTTTDRQCPYRFLDETGGPALLLGWLSQHHQLGVVTAHADLERVALHAAADATLLKGAGTHTDWAYAQLIVPHSYDEEPMVHYLHAVASYNQARPLQNGPLLTGWCSWYHYYENISAASLRENFAKLSHLRTQLPTNVAVVDDGYMTAWGDWESLKPGKFGTTGLRGVANDIKAFGMRPGLWLAPFACDKHSQVAKDHPTWIIRNDQGRPANSANCGKFFYGLDATNPEVRAYVHHFVKKAVHEWGFDVLKIDFLYAACLEGNSKYDLAMTRAEAMHLALQTIRAAAGPDVFLIGCGCPIGTAIGYVDGMRVSADTGPTWYPTFPLPWWDNGTLPSLRAMVRNSISRAPLGHRWWHNDPDCLLLGETTKLSNKEVASAASIVAMTCGMMLLSDDLTKVSPARMKIVSKIFPMVGATAVVLDLHNTNDGLPSILRLWCTDRYGLKAPAVDAIDHNRAATFFGRHSSFSPDKPVPHPKERQRNCVHVCKGLGTWTLLSISNWLDEATVVHVPGLALSPPPETGWEDDDDNDISFLVNGEDKPAVKAKETPSADDQHPGYHVFAFWSSTYTWMPQLEKENYHGTSLSKRLEAHATEIFHVRTVTPDMPQYVGSDIHFSCGTEVLACEATSNGFDLELNCTYQREGHIFVYIPRHDLTSLSVAINGAEGEYEVVGNTPGTSKTIDGASCIGRIIRVPVVIRGDSTADDGEISITF